MILILNDMKKEQLARNYNSSLKFKNINLKILI
jgi:hypothetical protein